MVSQALDLPVICNLNPRSIYNKSDEFHEFIKEEQVDLLLMSESWERQDLPLNQIIQLEDFEIISNVSQRKNPGGRPAIFANKTKFQVQNLTNTLVNIPWGVEAVWAILTPKNASKASKIQNIACCAFYCKPGSKKKTLLLDHISETYNLLSTKYGRGLHFVLAGDSNDLKLDSILSLDSRLNQIVKDWTRLSPPAILDPIITTLSGLYQEPLCLEPLDADPNKKGVKSDHRIVVARPINTINNKCVRETRTIKFRPFPESGLKKMTEWLIDEKFEPVFSAISAHDKAEIFQQMLLRKLDECFPLKERKINGDDQPWISSKIKKMDRKRKREYHKHRRSEKWKVLNKLFKTETKRAKKDFYKNNLANLKTQKPSKWYSCLKKITSFDQHKREEIIVDEINHLSNQEQSEIIADKFASIQNEYQSLKKEDISVPPFSQDQVPQFQASQVWFLLSKLQTNKATVPGDFPAKLSKHFAAYLAEPLCDIINTSVRRGEYPRIYKFEHSTPVPKKFPPTSTADLRNISGLLTFDKIMGKLISELMISDMDSKSDSAQYGNQKGLSIQHYLIKMLHRIHTALDNNSRRETFAVIANMVDWNSAFPRQCHRLGVESFIKNGVRPSLIPVLINYFQDREMSVRWHGCTSVPRLIKGGGAQGATMGLLEYLSQSNNNADCVDILDRFKFIDDLTILEIINLLTVGISSLNLKLNVPNDAPLHNQFIPPQNLKSQKWLDEINAWTSNQKMKINENKTKTMIFNFSDKHQFTTRLQLNSQTVEVIKSTRLLGTIVSDDLKWDLNTKNIVKKANARMQLLRKVAEFGAPCEDLKTIYILFIRSLLEQSATVWHSSLSQENIEDLERVQKSAFKVILQEKFKGYKHALKTLEMESLKDRREYLCLNFALKCTKNKKVKDMFPLTTKIHEMKTRNPEKYHVNHTNTERLRKSAVPYMQRLLNENENRQH